MTYGNALYALADPTRRALFERQNRRPQTVRGRAEWADLRTRTVTEHLSVLREARLVTDRRDGTRRIYSSDREGLAALRQYLESFWDDVLAAYAADAAAGARASSPARARKTTKKRGPR